jgi:hypothetical protein
VLGRMGLVHSMLARRLDTHRPRQNGGDGATASFCALRTTRRRAAGQPTSIPLFATRVASSQKILRYLRRSCSSRAMRLDLVMLIIARRDQRRDKRCVQVGSEWAVGRKGKDPGEPSTKGIRCKMGAARPGKPRVSLGAPRPAGMAAGRGSRNMGFDWLAAGLPTAASQCTAATKNPVPGAVFSTPAIVNHAAGIAPALFKETPRVYTTRQRQRKCL